MFYQSSLHGWYTFQYCANYFTQLFIIRGFKNGHYVPVVFGILPDKKYETYVNFFKILIDKCSEFCLNLNPLKVVSHFEASIQKACRFWASANFVGCGFHLTQICYRKIQKLGLTAEFRDENSTIGAYLRIHFGIQFLNQLDAVDIFNNELHYLMP